MDDQSRDLAGYVEFYRTHITRLTAFLTYNGFSTADAADCAQEAMIAALPPVWASVEHPYTWCRRVAYRKASGLPSREVPTSELNDRTANPLYGSRSDLDQVEQQDEYLYWLRQLKGEKQRAVMAWSIDEAKPAEIAIELGMDVATVRSTLYQARSALKRIRGAGGEQ